MTAVHVLHALPGRVRLHLRAWRGAGAGELARRLRTLPGIERVSVNPTTHNVLVHFDSSVTDAHRLRSAAPDLVRGLPAGEPDVREVSRRPRAEAEGRDGRRRVRIPVRGLERNPKTAERVLATLRRRPGVSATASVLTGRVLIEYAATVALEELIADVIGAEPPGEDEALVPHVLDRGVIIQSTARLTASLLGLATLVGAQLRGVRLQDRRAMRVAGLISILQGNPFTRRAIRRLLGSNLADAALALPGIVSQTLAGNPIGLSLAAADALRVLSHTRTLQRAWRRYEAQASHAPPAEPHAVVHLDSGERCPLAARLLDGSGVMIDAEGRPVGVAPGASIPEGARLYGGPFTVRLGRAVPVPPIEPPPERPRAPSELYVAAAGTGSLLLATTLGIAGRAAARAFDTLLLVSARPAILGGAAAETGARARVARLGGVLVGTRPERRLRRHHLLLLSGTRLLTDGLELVQAVPLSPEIDAEPLLGLAAAVDESAGGPWGSAFRGGRRPAAAPGSFDGTVARAAIEGETYCLRPAPRRGGVPAGLLLRHRSDVVLELQRERDGVPLGVLILRPRLAAACQELVRTCKAGGWRVAVLSRGRGFTSRALAQRAGVGLERLRAGAAIAAAQSRGARVCYVSDGPEAAHGFARADLGVAIVDPGAPFGARADVLLTGLDTLVGLVDASNRAEVVRRDAVAIAFATNTVGTYWAVRGGRRPLSGGRLVELGSFAALIDAYARLHGGDRTRAAHRLAAEPRPEQWGRHSTADVLAAFGSSPTGLTSAEARLRQGVTAAPGRTHAFLDALATEARSPLIALLAAGAIMSLLLGSAGDVVIILLTLAVNVVLGAWQGQRATHLADAVRELREPVARLLRDGALVSVAAHDVVPGDILILGPGDRVAADARLVEADGLEVDEAALTGESLPVVKTAEPTANGAAVVLAGSDVAVGRGQAVVIAVGERTYMGFTAAALASVEPPSPLGVRLTQLVRVIVPLVFAGGGVVVVAGVARGRPLLPELALGLSVALAAFPEGLPLMAAVGQSAAAHRLAQRRALVRRVAAVEVLGRVDVACVDKTGTLTEGRLALRALSDFDAEATLPVPLPPRLADVLLAAALASPHPDSDGAMAHATDRAVLRAAEEVGYAAAIRAVRDGEARFSSNRAFHATRSDGAVAVKGAPEVVLPRCDAVRRAGRTAPLGDEERRRLEDAAGRMAERGLRVLAVAIGGAQTSLDDPHGLTAVGLLGISDPLRPSVPDAVRRCRDAGIRLVMLTGDHPATARRIAADAGLPSEPDAVLPAAELASASDDELAERLARVSVIARATPLDKLRIVEALQRAGHVVAMTGDGVNDAPALRLAEVGVAMGMAGTEVARQAADVVLADDDFATLVEALVEGRGFWHNIRRGLGLLLGGNLGELLLVSGASILGRDVPLTIRQVLATNLITDALPALAVVTQPPEHRHLALLAREGTQALDRPLRADIGRRAIATALPSTVAYLARLRGGGAREGRTVAFGSIVATQLAQTLALGRSDGTLTRPVAAATVASAAALGAVLLVPALRGAFELVMPGRAGWIAMAASAVVAPPISRLLASVPGLSGLAVER